jgi:serine/threonine protein phosphatase 1
MKIFAIGDIHGKIYKLRRLVDRLYMDDTSLLIFLGDYIDRGGHSFEVIEYLIELSKRYNCIFVKGNHEEMFMDFMSGINETMFTGNGGHKTIESYEKHGYDINLYTYYIDRELPKSHIKFYQGLKNYYQTEDYIFIHAGLLDDLPLEKQPVETLLWERYDFINSDFDWGKKVIFGHTPNKEILKMHNKICIDTGAYYEDGKLTCIILPEESFVQQGTTIEENFKKNN